MMDWKAVVSVQATRIEHMSLEIVLTKLQNDTLRIAHYYHITLGYSDASERQLTGMLDDLLPDDVLKTLEQPALDSWAAVEKELV